MCPILYLLFIDRYATNSFYGDDWSVVPTIQDALGRHVSLGPLWAQYNESRLVLGNIIDIVFGHLDQFDLRSVILFSAALYIASYALVLALFRRYLGSRLTPIPVLIIGTIWFSLADVQNALWAFQVSWYLTVFFLVAMLSALNLPTGRRWLWLVVALAAACAASLSTIQGFLCWPLGVLCILWTRSSWRRASGEALAWCSTAFVLLLVYFRGYDFNNNGCLPPSACSPSATLHHPVNGLSFLLALPGNVIPDGINFGGVIEPVHDVARLELVGGVLLCVAVFILVQSWRLRASRERFPLPALLIVFALLFDVTITLGRGLTGATGAASSNRYVMANLILLSGIFLYAWAHVPPWVQAAHATGHATGRRQLSRLAVVAAAVFLVVQVGTATDFGFRNGRAVSDALTYQARFLVNADRVPKRERLCEIEVQFVFQPGSSPSRIGSAVQGHLGEFRPSSRRFYREQGLPPPLPRCAQAGRTSPVPAKVSSSP